MKNLPANSEPQLSELSDQALLHLFSMHLNHMAFTEIVYRYQKLVMSVCRRTARNPQDAEDAFQATFVTLAKRPLHLRKADSLSSWLYGVAWRTSVRAVRRKRKQITVPLPEDVRSEAEEPFLEISRSREMTVLEEELNLLPDRYRKVLVMNFLAGQSSQQIADQLQTTRGVVDGRLQRAKNALRVRLVRRGVTMSVLGTVAASTSNAQAAAAPAVVEGSISDGLSVLSGNATTPSSIASLARPETFGASLPTAPSLAAIVVIMVTLLGWLAGSNSQAAAFTPPKLNAEIDVDQTQDQQTRKLNVNIRIEFLMSFEITPATAAANTREPDSASNSKDAPNAEDRKRLEMEEQTKKREQEILNYEGAWGSFAGQVVLKGEAPAPKLIHAKGANIKNAAVCSALDTYDQSLLVDSDSNGIANCYIYLRRAPELIHPLLQDVKNRRLLQDQKDCQFIPHCQFIQVGQQIEVISSDTVAHNIHTYPLRSTAASIIVPLSKPESGVVLTPDRAELLPFQIKCDFHPWMKGYWLVLDHPYAAITDSKGNFRIPGLPAGKHVFRIWHERVGYINREYEVEVIDGELNEVKPILLSVERVVE